MTKQSTTINLLKKSILAGILIGLGGFAFLSIDNKIIGSTLFSFGLISVVLLGQKLYTGIIGYAKWSERLSVIIVLVGNFIGSALMGVMCSPFINLLSTYVITNKLNTTIPNMFIKSIICGMLIYLAVELYKHKQNLLCLIFPIVIFILSGAEHCIANIFYCFASMNFDVRMIHFIPICIIGNSVGSIIIRMLQNNIILKDNEMEIK